MVQRDKGDPTGFHRLLPGDPGYPTPEQLARLKGKPTPNVQIIADAMGEFPEDAELEELLSHSGGLEETEHTNEVFSEVREALKSLRSPKKKSQ